ncbi:IclR family transcriptional regulator [Paracoccus sp. PAR01]|uniref:IclR family transcriptional regulator n=1 Tax=Paracoccus sp. PAR01 TaxID=2769282 RepID=UPI001783CB10|nr:IclR family transcriptional regulator [Paracoccus sp. PAR01]MBD9528515.1 IclR family transcriptional regulator [Paracoccus sp. PAR01]
MFRELTGVSTFDPAEAEQFGEDPLFVRAAARAVAILSVFEMTPKPLTLSEISELSGMDRSATQRMVHTLQALGMIMRDDEDRGYLPGKRILTMACSSLRLNPILQKATPVLLELRRRSHERVDMSLWDDTRLIYALRMPSKHEIFTATLTGNTVPTYCTAGGLAVLSRLSDAEIADIFARSDVTPFTPQTITTLDQVMAEVQATRQRGHAVAVRQLLHHEIALGVAVLDGQGRPVGAIHLAGSLDEHSAEDFSARFGSLLRQAGQSLSGYR